MGIDFSLGCVAVLLGLAVLAVALVRHSSASVVTYSAALLVSTGLGINAVIHLVIGAASESVILPLALPWVGAHFRLDPLSAVFLVIVNLGGAGASLYGLGYGRDGTECARVVPFFSGLLVGLDPVVV